MTRRSKYALQAVCWVLALAVGAVGMLAALKKDVADAETRAALAMAEADFFRDDLRQSKTHGYAETDVRGRITAWNPALTIWLGWTEEELLGRNITEIMEPESAAKHAPKFKALMADKSKWKQVARLPCQAKHKDKDHPPVAIYVTARAMPTREDPDVPYSFAQIDLQSRVIEPDPPLVETIKQAMTAVAEHANQEAKP